jgi:tetratricopeptide (TPR) repeat protein
MLIGILIFAYALICPAAEPKWIEVKSPNFTVISDASKKKARKVAKKLEQFRVVFSSAFPKLRTDLPSPLTVFAARNEKSLKRLIPSDYGKDGVMTPAGIFLAGPESRFVVFRADVPGDQDYHIIYHEYTHMLMNLNFQSLPLWLSEGLAELFGYTVVSDGDSRLGQPSPESLHVLKTSPLLPLTTLMRVAHDSPYYRQRDKAAIFYAQSWALAHYLMMGERQQNLPKLNEFLLQMENGVSDEEAEVRAFGSLAELQRNLEQYIHQFSFFYGSIKTELSIKEDQFAVRELPEAESLALRGEVLVCANRLDEASAMLKQALQLNPRSAVASQAMGFYFLRLNQMEEAQKYFSEAANLDSKSYLAQYFAAQMAYEKDMDYGASESYLRKAMEINPNFAPAYGMLSQILMMQQEKDAWQEALKLGVRAAELEPTELSHSINVGRILVEMEEYDKAQSLAKRILAVARSEADRGQAETLLLMVERRKNRELEARRQEQEWKEKARKAEEQRHTTRELERGPQSETTDQVMDSESPLSGIKTGPAGRVSGIIGSVKCGFPAIMDIVLDSNGKQILLRAANYFEVRYWAVEAPGKTGFQPCKELEGNNVEIEFLSVMDQEFSGLIQAIAIK